MFKINNKNIRGGYDMLKVNNNDIRAMTLLRSGVDGVP